MTVEAVARAVLYEGFALYPYRASAAKNARRVLLGTVDPGGEARAECLVRGDDPEITATLRFLDPEDGSEVSFEAPLSFDGGRAELDVEVLRPDLRRVRVRALTTSRPLAAAHFVLRATRGTWLSRQDPPDDVTLETDACSDVGLYPVLVGDAVLAAPIILSDHPALAPESGGDLFDATEIEEILCLRVKTLSDAEKTELRRGGGAGAAILARVEAMTGDDFLRMHGARRDVLARGDRVTLRPHRRADALDVVLRGLAATIISIDDTVEGDRLYSVTIDSDPGSDLGAQGFPGHRFFFRADELVKIP